MINVLGSDKSTFCLAHEEGHDGVDRCHPNCRRSGGREQAAATPSAMGPVGDGLLQRRRVFARKKQTPATTINQSVFCVSFFTDTFSVTILNSTFVLITMLEGKKKGKLIEKKYKKMSLAVDYCCSETSV